MTLFTEFLAKLNGTSGDGATLTGCFDGPEYGHSARAVRTAS